MIPNENAPRVSPARRGRWAWMAGLALAGLLTAGCPKQLPSAGFYGLNLKTVQSSPEAPALKLDFELLFVVRNPLPRRITIPAHGFRLTLDGRPVASGTQPELVVEPGATPRLKYDFALDLGSEAFTGLLGRDDVAYAFEAEADLDIPELLDLGKGGSPGDMGGVKGALPAEITGRKLALAHEGQLRLPLIPRIEPATGAPPLVDFLGAQSQKLASVDPASELAQLRNALAPFVAALDQGLQRQPALNTTLSATQVLGMLGIPENRVDTALTLLRTAGFRVPGRDNPLPIPVPNAPTPLQVLQNVDPAAVNKWTSFKQAWDRFDPARYAGALVVPTSLPHGVRVAIPFRLRNPNAFKIKIPAFRMNALRAAEGDLIASLRAVPIAQVSAAATTPIKSEVEIDGRSVMDMAMVTELRWDQLGGLFSAMQGRAPPPLKLTGEVVLDLGLGEVVVPINLQP